VSIDLNALAAELANQLAAAPTPTRDADAGTPRASGELAVIPPAPRGVRFTTGDVRLGDFLDHTLLRPEATRRDLERLCTEARERKLASVCVNPIWVPVVSELLSGSGVAPTTVVGFPLGATATDVKVAETTLAVRQGATEVDMVVSLGALRAGEWDEVEREVAAVVAAATPGGALVKVILESALLAPMQLMQACIAVRDGGADYVKTSTGFHAAGGATPDAVALMRLAVGDSMGVKASGGIRDASTAFAMIAAGATRLGTSAGVELADARGPGPRTLASLLRLGPQGSAGVQGASDPRSRRPAAPTPADLPAAELTGLGAPGVVADHHPPTGA